ncbi:MAG TPA: isoprenylcysteine carboxylmethyltransferase family protein [Burkholderiales bacterium]|nr:isoprenylcysteine carboxylmethyltransferase family protein [Burkholderiales bacterium]
MGDEDEMSVLELRIPPPVVMLLTGILMRLASSVMPALAFPIPARVALAVALAVAGFVVASVAFFSFRRVRTTVDPRKPDEATNLVAAGLYKVTRNPMYLGLLLILTGWAIFLANAMAFVFLPVFVLYLNRFQIEPEERALALKFGAQYAAYRAKVRRWL